ncbi:hypothetical protein FACS1894104_4740 [Actinomycetota bacterium]|nr:hypothetical protein FACS1894104_4740 [Actinomycetota bacterium]
MFKKVASIKPQNNYHLLVHFESGETMQYDLAALFNKWEVFRSLEQTAGLFELVKIDPGGYGISWNEDIDISADELFTNGKDILV